MNLNFLISDIGNDIQKRLVPDWKQALSFYSVKAGIIGGSVLAGIAALLISAPVLTDLVTTLSADAIGATSDLMKP